LIKNGFVITLTEANAINMLFIIVVTERDEEKSNLPA